MSLHYNPDYTGTGDSSMLNVSQFSLSDYAHRPINIMMSSSSASVPSIPSQGNLSSSNYYAAQPHAQPAISHPPSHTHGFSLGSSAGVNGSSLSLSTTPSNLPAPNGIGSDAGFNPSQTTWQSTILQNQQIVAEWQARLLAQLPHIHSQRIPPPTPPANHSTPPISSPPAFRVNSTFADDKIRTTHVSVPPHSDETNHRSNPSFAANDPSPSSGTDSGPRSSKKKSKKAEPSPSDGTIGNSFGSRGSGGSAADVYLDNLDATSSSSPRHKKKKDKKDKKSKSKKGKKKTMQVDLHPRKKKSEQQRSNSHMILTLDHLTTLFHLPLKRAADELGICTTALKSVCRKFGLERWPFCRGNKDDDRGLDLVPPQAQDGRLSAQSRD